MHILLIAPTHADLPSIDAEYAAISRFHDVKRVVRDGDILHAIEADQYDILWFATHGSSAGVQLSDSILSPEGVGQYVGTSGAKLCVLNTCASENVALRIIAGGEADMIFTISADVKDADALRFGSLLAGKLAETADFEDAFNKAAGPGATKYRYLRAKQALRGLALHAADATERMKEQITRLELAQYKLTVDMQALTERMSQQIQQALLSQQQAIQARGGAGGAASHAPAVPTLTPTFWAVIIVGVFLVGVIAFFLGRG